MTSYSISVDELRIAFSLLPANSDQRLHFINLVLLLPDQSGQTRRFPLQFDWNSSCQDWELSPGQPILITASSRVVNHTS